MKVNTGQAPSTLIPEYIGSDFDKVITVVDNIETVTEVVNNLDHIKAVDGNLENIVTVADNVTDVGSVDGSAGAAGVAGSSVLAGSSFFSAGLISEILPSLTTIVVPSFCKYSPSSEVTTSPTAGAPESLLISSSLPSAPTTFIAFI